MDNNNIYKVYCLTLKQDNRKYFGCTKNTLKHRWNKGKGHSYGGKMQKAIKEYGWDSFSHELIKDNLSEEEAFSLEEKLIKEFKTQNELYGFNSSSGGKSSAKGCTRSDETKLKVALKTKGLKRSDEFRENQRKRMTGRTVAETTKQKIREVNLGKKLSDETKQKISLANSGKPNAMKGKTYSEEFKKKCSQAHKGHITSEETKKKLRTNNPNCKPIICIETGVVYSSVHEASRILNIDFRLISGVVRGVTKSTNKLHFKYIEKEN
ncbi:MAG: NUMOD3 domain-containing DNA-binding protein [Bacilli bacterium]|nr:NUMOD3 domain-containing DNA-binding protein [Bacilli bacterium]